MFKFLRTNKQLRNEIEGLHIYIRALEKSANPFDPDPIPIPEGNHWVYWLGGTARGITIFDEVEEILEKLFRDNISTDVYLERIRKEAIERAI